MPPHSDEDDFGLSSSDEADLLAIADDVETRGVKRKNSADLPPSKRTKYSSATQALSQFGLRAFRLKQEQVISRILGGDSATVVFPTGGGKSLCYQIPALVFAEEDSIAGIRGERDSGITLVVSPLLALMKDQVDVLVRRGIAAATLDSTKTSEEYRETCAKLRNGELKILYCAPERLNNEGFVQQMAYVRGGVRLLAVDEAHCISEWGHAFRPDYLKVARFAQEIKAERVICLTATATPRVATDICKAFNIDAEVGLFRTSTYRPNLELIVESAKTKQDAYPKLFKFLKNNPGASIVYVTLQKQTETLASSLRDQGFQARAFHAGMDTGAKTQLQNDFMASENLIIVATIAFGMGIDKATIRNVVHFNIPSSLESYSQEIGRAGRDGLPSKCMFYVCGEDLHLREIFARGDLPSKESVHRLLREIFSPVSVALPVGHELTFAHLAQQKEYDIKSTTLSNIYAQLELTHGFIRASTPKYTKYSYKTGPQYGKLFSDNSPTAAAITKFAKKASTWFHIDVEATAHATGIDRSDLVRKLNDLNEMQVIEMQVSGVLNVYKILKHLPKTTGEIEDLLHSIFTGMEEREQQALNRTDEMLALVTSQACFSRLLAEHFGDGLLEGKVECGHCTWCNSHKAVVQQLPPPVPFNWSAFNAIKDRIPDRDDARFLARVAFGITSPRVNTLKLSKDPVYGSMADHGFLDLLGAFNSECSKANQGVDAKSIPPTRNSTSASKGGGTSSASRGGSKSYPRRGGKSNPRK